MIGKRLLLSCVICLIVLFSACQTETPVQQETHQQSLDMPNKIRYSSESYDGPQIFLIEAVDEQTVRLTTDLGDYVEKTFSDSQIEQLNKLHQSITDYSNVIRFDYPDTTFYYDDHTYTFNSIYTTQVELEQYMNMLFAYIEGVEYDMSVEPRDFDEIP